MRRRALANSHACIVEWEWECRADREYTPVVGGARCSSTSSPCAMGVMAINSYNNNWSHDSDSLLEMTPVVSGPRMLMYGLTHPKQPLHRKGVQNDLPTEKEADIRAQIDPMKEVLHCGTVEPGVRGRNKRG